MKRALINGKVHELPHFGEKSEARLLEEIARLEKKKSERILLARAEEIAEPLLEYLKSIAGVKRAGAAGSYRRRKATVGDLDIVVTCTKGSKELGVKIVISTDAHNISSLDFMKYGIGQARRGWLEAQNVVNTRPSSELRTRLRPFH